MIDRNETRWYRDAIVYQLHVKSFFDSNGDGIGDFEGVTQKLDYIKELGVTALWVMPFYPSPLRDDGYDIADYRGINPSYGTMRDFKKFVKAAHERDLRVIIELVINHTSDQHPWFQKARTSPPGSAARDFYVWSDTDRKYDGTRIIFLDTEASNWTWDPVAKAYYWHRFYSHQPDLNFDNPRVLDAVLDTMRFWLSTGVDGLRLDAIPYLIERDGTNCENLPETHVVLKKIRAAVDAEYPDRMLLAEANQWPEDTAHYFGNGDECHMAFHFPLMPRMYMAVAQEDRHPITDIMRQTPEIPDGCQWAIFLRNHDELTLEMVTDLERDYLWSFYASDKRARINLGIRRRLAPLLQSDRRKIELLNSLLLSMPGTPVMYYGDEIGMGDNIYLGDRDGVRTPMQWSPDRNGGFSRADPQRLFLPAIQDAAFGFASVNVEAQVNSPASLLNWVRRMISVRRSQRVFGSGALRFLYPVNRKVLAYVRELDDVRVLCVANLSAAPQSVELDLSEFKGAVPLEMTGGSYFPAIGTLPYLLTLSAYGFFWFNLSARMSDVSRFGPRSTPELLTLVRTDGLASILRGREATAFDRVIPAFLRERRWFGAKGRSIKSAHVVDAATLRDGRTERFVLPLASIDLGGEQQTYFLPLANAKEDEVLVAHAFARLRQNAKVDLLIDAAYTPEFALAVVAQMRAAADLKTMQGATLRFSATPMMPEVLPTDPAQVRRMNSEQSNTSIAFAEEAVLKLFRRLQPGIHPEIEMCRFLQEVAGFRNVPPVLGTLDHIASDGTTTSLAILQAFIPNQGDAWAMTHNALQREFDHVAVIPEAEGWSSDQAETYTRYSAILGKRTGEMHRALAVETDDPAFASEPLTLRDVQATIADVRRLSEKAFAAVAKLGPTIAEGNRDVVELFLGEQARCLATIATLEHEPVGAIKTRIHGDYHLGQVLVTSGDVQIVDFEGEPARTIEERRAKDSPMRDVAGMLRSFAYAADASARDVVARLTNAEPRIAATALAWKTLVDRTFLAAYDDAVQGSPIAIADDDTRARLMRLYLLQKALYEVLYEANNRPDWIATPIRGVLAALDQGEAK